MIIAKVTLTGVDDSSSVSDMEFLSDYFTNVEWGILYSPSRAGNGGRYPSVAKIQQLLEDAPERLSLALHICGVGVLEFLNDETTISNLVNKLNSRRGRVQLNFNHSRSPFPIDLLEKKILEYPRIKFIAQIHGGNSSILDSLEKIGVTFLHDSSGGSGMSPEEWPLPRGKFCGYAGGLGPGNIINELSKISNLFDENSLNNRVNVWVDMESSLRNKHDEFDFFKCYKVLALLTIHDYVSVWS